MLEVARKHLESQGVQAEYVVGHATALPFDDASVDLVTCRIAAHHFRDAGAFFAEADRVLVSGGRLAFQDQALPDAATSACMVDEFERVRDPSHRRSYSVEGWTRSPNVPGLVVERSEVFEKRHEFAEWCDRQSCSAEKVAALEEIAPPRRRRRASGWPPSGRPTGRRAARVQWPSSRAARAQALGRSRPRRRYLRSCATPALSSRSHSWSWSRHSHSRSGRPGSSASASRTLCPPSWHSTQCLRAHAYAFSCGPT